LTDTLWNTVEGVIGYDVYSTLNNISVISWREQDNEIGFVLDQHDELDFNRASSLKQLSMGRHVAPLAHIILILSQPVFALTP
jgi:hypothetical protein